MGPGLRRDDGIGETGSHRDIQSYSRSTRQQCGGIPALTAFTLAEVGAALFEEGGRALLRFLAVVIKRQRLEAQGADAPDIVAIGVKGALRDRDRGGAERQDLAAPRLDFGIKLLGGHDLVDEAHLKRLGGGIAAAQKPDLARPLVADMTREKRGAPAGIDRADARSDLAEDGLLGGDRQVADRRQHVAAADRVALHLGDDRLPALADHAVQFLDRQTNETAAAIALVRLRAAGARRIVAARAKGAIPCPGQHDNADIGILFGVAHGLEHLLDGAGAERVQHRRAVDRDRRNAVALLVEDVLIRHEVYSRPVEFRPGRCGRGDWVARPPRWPTLYLWHNLRRGHEDPALPYIQIRAHEPAGRISQGPRARAGGKRRRGIE